MNDVSAWIELHGVVDVAVQVALVAFLLLLTLMSASGSTYWSWWLSRAFAGPG